MENYAETDEETVSSWNDQTDDETEIDDEIYEPEEICLTKYNIVLCERYNIFTHGLADEARYHYLTHLRFKNLNMNLINDIKNLSPNLKLEIAECLYLPSQHCVSIIKTHWLKIIQRTWKKIYREKKNIIRKRCNPNSIKYREIYGRWPNDCINYPQFRGMLHNLSRALS